MDADLEKRARELLAALDAAVSEKIATGRPFADIALPIIAAALSAGQADARRLSEAPLVTVKADAIGNHIDLPSWHAADPQPGTYRLVPERGEVSDG